MSKKRFIDTAFWSDPWVVDDLDRLERYLFLYFLTNDKTNIAGVYEMSLRTISYESGIEKDELLVMLKRLETRIKYVDGWVILRKAIKNQNYKNTKIKAGIEIVLSTIPEFCFEYLDLPPDFGNYAQNKNKQTSLIDDTSMTHGRYSDSDSDSDSDASPQSYKFKSSDAALLQKERQAKKRKPDKISYAKARTASEVAREKLKARGILK